MKSQFQDIIPPEKRSIRNITLRDVSAHDKESTLESDLTDRDYILSEESSSHLHKQGHKRKKTSKREVHHDEEIIFAGRSDSRLSKIVLWGITIVSVLVLFLVLTHFLNSATVQVKVKSWEVLLPTNLDLSLEPNPGQVGYSTVVLTDSLSETLPATGEKEVATKSTGTIIIYNNFDSNVQNLVAGTRFETPKGLIYKLDKPVSVPGIKTVSGKSTPGSVEVKVTAENTGKTYNIGLEDFTIPGFKGTSKYTKFYARSKTPMTGGDLGKIAIVPDSLLMTKVSELKTKLETKLKEKAAKELPPDQVVVSGLSTIEYTVSTPVLSGGNNATVEVTGNMKVYLLDGTTLAEALLQKEGVVAEPNEQYVFKTDQASASFASSTTSVSNINFSGSVTFGYKLDAEKFKSEIAGITSDEVPTVAQKHPAISEVRTTVRPFWKSSLPDNLEKITVVQE